MTKFFSALLLALVILGSAAPPAVACNGTVHLPGCGASGNIC